MINTIKDAIRTISYKINELKLLREIRIKTEQQKDRDYNKEGYYIPYRV